MMPNVRTINAISLAQALDSYGRQLKFINQQVLRLGLETAEAHLCIKAVLPSMMEHRCGRIINISSRAYLGNPGHTNYSAAKAGLLRFTRALARGRAKFNITANAITPSFIDTKLVKSLLIYERLRDAASARNPGHALGVRKTLPMPFCSWLRILGLHTGAALHATGGLYFS